MSSLPAPSTVSSTRPTIRSIHSVYPPTNRTLRIMSVKVMAMVWETNLPPHLKLVLLAYADHANDTGDSVYPGEETMTEKTSYSAQTIRRNTRALIDGGFLTRTKKGYRGQRAEYRINLTELKASHIDTLSKPSHLDDESLSSDTESLSSDTESLSSDASKPLTGDTPNHHEPSEPSENHQLAARPRNPTWDTLIELFGEPTPARTALYGRVTKYLTNQNATPDLIRERATRIVTDWGPEKLTITSLETHWSRFDGLAGQITNTDVKAAELRRARDEMHAAIDGYNE